ncbi:hypothetical protein F0223_16795 [Vibrio coralliilyticus]|uniref:hypothetical protein n=1 Tax=Vibrio TaxID=662 RepID=UPI0005004CDF|nr:MULTISPECIES: hypothetical protein [Vibrio]KFI10857.1 hypothetical protein IX95_18640 [Vibrio sp. B183]NOI19887.1 hypothetical protein [Vibrio coralliilyticus]
MNEDILFRNSISNIIGLTGFLCIIGCFYFHVPILLWIGFVLVFVAWITQVGMRFCDFCGKRLEYARQQFKLDDLFSCSTCERKIRTGKISIDNPEYKLYQLEQREKTANK